MALIRRAGIEAKYWQQSEWSEPMRGTGTEQQHDTCIHADRNQTENAKYVECAKSLAICGDYTKMNAAIPPKWYLRVLL